VVFCNERADSVRTADTRPGNPLKKTRVKRVSRMEEEGGRREAGSSVRRGKKTLKRESRSKTGGQQMGAINRTRKGDRVSQKNSGPRKAHWFSRESGGGGISKLFSESHHF